MTDREPAHPLVVELIDTLRAASVGGPVIEVGSGSGRNTRALEAAGITVTALDDGTTYTQLSVPARRFAAGISTHAYLHGETGKVRVGLAELGRVLVPRAPVVLTLGSIRDTRFGFGIPYDDTTFAPGDGPEMGIPHAYFDREGALDVLRPFEVLSLEEVPVDEIVGRWAHDTQEANGRIHWFVRARKR